MRSPEKRIDPFPSFDSALDGRRLRRRHDFLFSGARRLAEVQARVDCPIAAFRGSNLKVGTVEHGSLRTQDVVEALEGLVKVGVLL